jgi:hypothetical protein
MLLFGIVGVLLLYFTYASPTPGMYGSIEQDQVNRINNRRASIGRSALKHIECLNSVAEQHTIEMVNRGSIYHTPNDTFISRVNSKCGGTWSILGENVGSGYDSASLFNAFMSSASHKANIEDTRFAKVGLGAYYATDGRLFITQIFANCSSCTTQWNTTATLPNDPSDSGSSCPATTTNSTPRRNGLQIATKVDFNGDGRSDVFWYGPSDVNDTIWYFNSTMASASPASTSVSGSYLPVHGDFNGDGYSDVLWYGSGSLGDSMWYGTATKGSFRKGICVSVGGAGYVPIPGDFNGDGYSDVFWYGPGSKADSIWYFTGTDGKYTPVTTSVGGIYRPVHGDFNGDLKSDIFWYGPGSKADSIWYGTTTKGSFSHYTKISVSGTDYVPLPGDFNGDLKSDIFWYGPGSINDSAWYFTSEQGKYSAKSKSVGGTYTPVPGDFNGDSKSDLLWYGRGGTSDSMWYGNANSSFTSSTDINVAGSSYLPIPVVNE